MRRKEMKLNLDTLRTEMDAYLKDSGFIVFYGMSRSVEDVPEVDWDTGQYPDYRMFLDVASQLGAKLVVMHHRQFNATIIDRALAELQAATFEYDDQRHFENRLRELNMYDGFTCALELSFDHGGTMYMYELRTDWYNELNEILDQLDIGSDRDNGDENDGTFGGYYSKN